MSHPFDLDIETLLLQKIEYHREQMRHHGKMASDARKKLELVRASKPENADINNSPKPDTVEYGGSAPVVNEMISAGVKYWKPKVEEYLKAVENPLKTEDIFSGIMPSSYYHPDEKRKLIGIISSCLYALAENGKVVRLPSDGRGYLYAWKR